MAEYAHLTEAQRERLEVLAEEATEVAQQCMKILRHGYQTTDHVTGTEYNNRSLLTAELLDLWTVMERMVYHTDIGPPDYNRSASLWAKKMQYMHHQPPFSHPLARS